MARSTRVSARVCDSTVAGELNPGIDHHRNLLLGSFGTRTIRKSNSPTAESAKGFKFNHVSCVP